MSATKQTKGTSAGTQAEIQPKLRAGIVYSGDNGQHICLQCAGSSALYTGRDISGQRVSAFTAEDAIEWEKMIGRPLACERGCTVI